MPSPESIIAATAAVTGVPVAAITGRRRNRHVAWARFLAIAAVRESCNWWTLQETGDFFNRDYTSIIHANQRHTDLLTTEPSYAGDWKNLLSYITT